MKQETVSINGAVYDKHTGIMLRNDRIASPAKPAQMQATKAKPVLRTHKPLSIAPSAPRRVDSFAPHPVAMKPQAKPDFSAPRNVAAPVAAKAAAATAARRPAAPAPAPTHTPAQVLKRQAIEEALAAPRAPAKHRTPKVKKERSRTWKHASLFATSLAVLLLGGYFTYLYMPNLSVKVAASQAGIDASYPGYRPDGYKLDGPVAFSHGEVKLNFLSNTNDKRFAVTQSTSAWDSDAVLSNYVLPQTDENGYTVNRENGLTIYKYKNRASWVNKGILYSITGDAPLSSEQVSRIALSM